jgi:hypothetical protein
MAKKTGGSKREASALNPLKRFFECVHDEPEHAAYFAKKIARDMADPLGNYNGRRFSVRHGQKLPHFSVGKRAKIETLKR